MASTERHLTACFDVPHANTVVARTAREPAIGKKHEIGDRSFMAVEDSDGDSVVELPDPDRAVIPTAGQRVAIRKYRDGVNTTLMPGQCKAPGTVAVVNQDQAIVARADQEFAAPVPRKARIGPVCAWIAPAACAFSKSQKRI